MSRFTQRYLRLASVGMAIAVPALVPTPATAADACPNAQVRAQQGVSLPDCRAFELISGDTNGASVETALRLSADTHGIAWFSLGAYADSRGVVANGNYGALRDADGWRVRSLTPAAADDVADVRSIYAGSFAIGGDMKNAAFWSGGGFTADEMETGPLQFHTFDVFKVGLGGVTTRVSQGPGFAGNNGNYPAVLDGLSDDPGGSTILFLSSEQLTADAPPDGTTSNLYRWRAGHLDLVSVDEAGQPLADGAALGNDSASQNVNAGAHEDAGRLADASMLSTDGTRFVYQSGGVGPMLKGHSGPGRLFLHVDGRPAVEISKSQRTGSVGVSALNGAKATDASPDFTRVYFISEDQLTDDAPVGGGAYLYDIASGHLSFIFPAPAPYLGDPTQGAVQISDDGKYIYFTSREDLAAGAAAGAQNLYVKHGADITFMTKLSGSEQLSAQPTYTSNWLRYPSLSVPASLDEVGDTLVFESSSSLGGANNAGHVAIYRYEAQTKELSCLSCRPSGTASQGDATLGPNAPDMRFAPPRFRNITNDGSAVVFSSVDAIVPQDTNGRRDVYEYRDGRVQLLTTGRGRTDAFLSGMSRDGVDVFIITGDSLTKDDGDGGYTDVYDLRVGGGRLAAEDPQECEPGACQPVAGAVVDRSTPGSARYESAGDPAVTRKPSCAAAATRVRVARTQVKHATSRYAKAKGKKAKARARRTRAAAVKRLKLYDSRLRSCQKGAK